MSVTIPVPITHEDEAKNHHLLPQCYMREWSYNGRQSVWAYDKVGKYNSANPVASNWSFESRNIERINALEGYHDLTAANAYLPEQALAEIFDPIIALGLQIHLDGELLDSRKKLHEKYGSFDQWQITDNTGCVLTVDERVALAKYFAESRCTYIETAWSRQYENYWRQFVADFENRLRREKCTHQGNGCQQTALIGNTDLERLYEYMVLFDWRQPKGGIILQSIFPNIINALGLSGYSIPSGDRRRVYETTIEDELLRDYLLKQYYDYLNNKTGLIDDTLKAYKSRFSPHFLLTDMSNPFITNDTPVFIAPWESCGDLLCFVIRPTLMATFGKGNYGEFSVGIATESEVKRCNKEIARKGKMLLSISNTFDLSALLCG